MTSGTLMDLDAQSAAQLLGREIAAALAPLIARSPGEVTAQVGFVPPTYPADLARAILRQDWPADVPVDQIIARMEREVPSAPAWALSAKRIGIEAHRLGLKRADARAMRKAGQQKATLNRWGVRPEPVGAEAHQAVVTRAEAAETQCSAQAAEIERLQREVCDLTAELAASKKTVRELQGAIEARPTVAVPTATVTGVATLPDGVRALVEHMLQLVHNGFDDDVVARRVNARLEPVLWVKPWMVTFVRVLAVPLRQGSAGCPSDDGQAVTR